MNEPYATPLKRPSDQGDVCASCSDEYKVNGIGMVRFKRDLRTGAQVCWYCDEVPERERVEYGAGCNGWCPCGVDFGDCDD